MRCLPIACALTIVLASAGCSRTQRHTVLTVFFEGVPPLEGEKSSGELPPATATAPPSRPGAEKGSSPNLSASAPENTIHPPYKERLCEACHKFARKDKGAFALIDLSAASTLSKPVPALCYGCHAAKQPDPLTLAGAWLHGPVAAGACTFCHHPHSSSTPYLLKAKPAAKFCQRCHEPGQMHLGGAEGIDDPECTTCHAGHKGKTRFLLEAPPAKEPPKPSPVPEGLKQSSSPEPSPTKAVGESDTQGTAVEKGTGRKQKG